MELIVCLDDRDGLLFNGRRLSRDQEVCRKCMTISDRRKLWLNPYSAKIFQEYTDRLSVSEAFQEIAGPEDICFAETVLPQMEKVNRLYVFRWNRSYPSDVRFSPVKAGFSLVSREDFPGKSHKMITLEVYGV